MLNRGSVKRSVASLLLVATTVVVGGRLALDIRSMPGPQSRIEVEHNACCATAHDHRLCLLVYHSPWSPAHAVPGIAQRAPQAKASPIPELIANRDGPIRPLRARSPPTPG